MAGVKTKLLDQRVQVVAGAARLPGRIGLALPPTPPVVGDAAKAGGCKGGQLVHPAAGMAGGGVQEDDWRAAAAAVGVPQADAWKGSVRHDRKGSLNGGRILAGQVARSE